MERSGQLQAVQPHLVYAQDIGQAYQFAASGNALLGFVALAQVVDETGKLKGGSMWVVPPKLYSPIRQDAVILAKGQGKAAAAALVKYLQGDKARAVIRGYGYDL